MQPVKNFIFDLGGVLIDLDFSRLEQSFNALGFKNFSDHFAQNFYNPPFFNYETGRIDEEEFVSEIKKQMPAVIKDQEIIDAWNSILLSFRPASLQFIKILKEKYSVFLYSNTNYTHFVEFQKRVPGGKQLEDYFHFTYYSFRIGMKKPDPESFLYILKENNLIAGETLFIDDSIVNIEGAASTGLQTHYLLPGQKIEDILSDYL